MTETSREGPARLLARAIYKVLYTAPRNFGSVLRKAFLSLIWEFEGRAVFDGRVHTRSAGGRVIVGADAFFGPDVSIECARGGVLRFGRRVGINQGTFIVCRGELTIGDDVIMGEYCSIRDSSHHWSDPSVAIMAQGYDTAPVVIEDGVWLGRGVVVQPGVTIGRGAIVGANAVVTKSVAPMAIVAGIPAKPMRLRG